MKRLFSRLLIFLIVVIGCWIWWQNGREHRYDKIISAAAQHYEISPALIKAVVWKESRFDPDVRGGVGEIGLMQIRKVAAQEWATAEHVVPFQHDFIFSPTTNIYAGSWYLKKLLKRYQNTDNPLPYALADYNAGRSNVLKWNKGPAATNSTTFIEQIGFPSTKNYVQSVMKRCEHYRSNFQAGLSGH